MESSETTRTGRIVGSVSDSEGVNSPISGAYITVHQTQTASGKSRTSKVEPSEKKYETFSDQNGSFAIENVESGSYDVRCECFGMFAMRGAVSVGAGRPSEVSFEMPLHFQSTFLITSEDILEESTRVKVGTEVVIRAEYNEEEAIKVDRVLWKSSKGTIGPSRDDNKQNIKNKEVFFTPPASGPIEIEGTLIGNFNGSPMKQVEPTAKARRELFVSEQPVQPIGGNVGVSLKRSITQRTADQALWVAIRNRTRAISFSGSGYKNFIDRVLCGGELPDDQPVLKRKFAELRTHAYGVGAYDLLKTATEAFLLLECGVAINQTGAHSDSDIFSSEQEATRLGEMFSLGQIQAKLTDYLGAGERRLPYINRIVQAVFPGDEVGNVHCYGVLTSKVKGPCLLELIWSYWHEEGMLVQTLNAVSRRFQNIRGPGDRDPLAHLEIDPLRPLNNLLWGYIQDEQNRLTVKRRAYEYDHHYGISLRGKAVPLLRPADSRSKFLEGFHNLLHLCSVFYKEDNDTTVISDGFPLMNALREVHLLLAQGAHNQFGDLPWTARADMLIQEWLLARPEMREFLQSRPMVPYKEGWMGQVDTMKTLQGWSDVTVTHFRDLGVFGEQILLSIRYGDWIDVTEEDSAKNWARYWRAEIQGYLHAYRAVTGIDLTNPDTVDSTVPAIHLEKRLALQQGRR
jgi:hypothetical protein